METKQNQDVIFSTKGTLSIVFKDNLILKEAGKIDVYETEIQFLLDSGETFIVSFRDLVAIHGDNYKIYLDIISEEQYIISQLGYKFDDVLRFCKSLYVSIVRQDLLLNESIRKSGMVGRLNIHEESIEERIYEQADIILFETYILCFTKQFDMIKIYLNQIDHFNTDNYALRLFTLDHTTYTIDMLGRDFDSFSKTFINLVNEESKRTTNFLKELLPQLNIIELRAATKLLKDGLVVKKEQLENISNHLWSSLEEYILQSSIKKEYAYLLQYAYDKKICIGAKRGLMGDMTGEYIWILIPMISLDKASKNAICMETIDLEGNTQATYFFRLAETEVLDTLTTNEKIEEYLDQFIKDFNHCMLSINFRREPIYLTNDMLQKEEYQKYMNTIQLVPELRMLRKMYLGRVIHRSYEQWTKDVDLILKFNLKNRAPNKKYKKGDD